MKAQAKLILVGAGPGDPDLITLKGIKALQGADAVLYDALANPELLEYSPGAEKIFVGKRKGLHRYGQEAINRLIVEKSKTCRTIVRLKGGDPFVFGRGSEEIEYARKNGLITEVVPGISSCLAVPASIGIPLTERGVSESFWVITGCNSERKLSQDLMTAARTSATVVILIGMHKLSQIVKVYEDLGKADLPVAIVQNGTLPHQSAGIGTVDNILKVVNEQNLSSPAVIVIGEVVTSASAVRAILSSQELEIAC
jgi:uroporphyrin-III C-methyltransferase